MVTNIFFNHYFNRAEQKLIEELVTESIKQYGCDVYYLPKTVFNADEVLNENQYHAFRDALQIDMYIKSVDGFEGDGQFMQKFGLEIRDQITLVVSRRTFDQDVIEYSNIIRPREGDAIYIPFIDAVYIIKYVEGDSPNFYQLGDLQSWELICELFEYSNEIFNTGVPEIDQRYGQMYVNENSDKVFETENGIKLITEFGDSILVEVSTDEEDNNEFHSFGDNREIQIDADNVIDFSERSPFGWEF
jgi:hypothetical protein